MPRILMFVIALAFSQICTAEDNKRLFQNLSVLAERGDAEAQYHLGMLYNNGIGTPQDLNKALSLFKTSAEAGDPLGAYKLGCYYAGQWPSVVNLDQASALKYKIIAANAGYSYAQSDVAMTYAQDQRYELAFKYWSMSAAQGYPQSLVYMLIAYDSGLGTSKNPSKAYAYLRLIQKLSGGQLPSAELAAKAEELVVQIDAKQQTNAIEFAENWQAKPTSLTIKATRGLQSAIEHVQKVNGN